LRKSPGFTIVAILTLASTTSGPIESADKLRSQNMNRISSLARFSHPALQCTLRIPRGGVLTILFVCLLGFTSLVRPRFAAAADSSRDHWVGTWAAAPQQRLGASLQTYRNQTLRLIVHTSVGGKKIRVRISNIYGDQPLVIGSAHVARRTHGAEIDPAADRTLTFSKARSTKIPAHSMLISDPVELDVPALSDLAVSIFLPNSTDASTTHVLALQTNYVSPEGDATSAVAFPVNKAITNWPFLTGVDVVTSPKGESIVAFGSSTTDGDGSSKDANRRWTDVLAERLQKEGYTELGVLNEGIIGNRLLTDTESPRQTGGPLAEVYEKLGPSLGQAGVLRFDRDVLGQAGVKYVVLLLGINDVLFPGSFIAASEGVSKEKLIAGNRKLIARAHKEQIKAIGTTIPPFEHALFRSPAFNDFYSPEKEKIRQEVNEWIRHGGEFDGVIDLDAVVRDPDHPTQLLPAYDSGDHLHVNDAGNVAQGSAIPLTLFSH
jgi:lysophospholipase L1-like esterase